MILAYLVVFAGFILLSNFKTLVFSPVLAWLNILTTSSCNKLENLEVSISFYNTKPLSIELPNQVTCTVSTTDVALKGQTVSSSYKPATLDNGLNIQVPPFIENEDKIIIDTRTMEYIKKI